MHYSKVEKVETISSIFWVGRPENTMPAVRLCLFCVLAGWGLPFSTELNGSSLIVHVALPLNFKELFPFFLVCVCIVTCICIFACVWAHLCRHAEAQGYVRNPPPLFCFINWSKFSQSNPEFSDIASLPSQLELRVLCPHIPRLESRWVTTPTWHFCEFWVFKFSSSHWCGKQF